MIVLSICLMFAGLVLLINLLTKINNLKSTNIITYIKIDKIDIKL